MFHRKLPVLGLSLALTAALLAGCGNSAASSGSSSDSTLSESTAEEDSTKSSSSAGTESAKTESSASSDDSSASAQSDVSSSSGTASSEIIKNEQYAVIDTTLPLQTGLLPSRMTELTSGGRIPSEALPGLDDKLPACVDPISLKGTWCVEGSDVNNPTAATDTRTDAVFISEDGGITELTVLPDTMVMGLATSGLASDTIYDLGLFSSYMLVDATYRKQDSTSFYAVMPYTVSGSTLAFGFYDAGEDDDADLAQEMDYRMDWTGWKLTLTYDEESITYVPTASIVNAESGVVATGGSIVAGYDGIDGITAVYPGGDDAYIAYGNEQYSAEFTFNEDGTAHIEVKNGKSYDLTFRYSGDTLTLIDGDHVALYAD